MNDPCDSRRSVVATVRGPAGKRGSLSIVAEVHAGDWSWLEALPALVDRACEAVAEAAASGAVLTADLALSDDASVKELNRTWRGQDKPTNVLSFPVSERRRAGKGPRHLGDIVIAEETLLSEARAGGIPARDHFQHLLVHGLLHLIGHDHIDEREAATMEALETKILAALGVPDPYAGTEPVTLGG
jgi:probable rRNA maturation factor